MRGRCGEDGTFTRNYDTAILQTRLRSAMIGVFCVRKIKLTMRALPSGVFPSRPLNLLALRDNNQRPSLKGWGESNPFDDRAIAFIGMKEVVSRIQLNPEQKRRVFTETLFKK